jgi:hypothetical protein
VQNEGGDRAPASAGLTIVRRVAPPDFSSDRLAAIEAKLDADDVAWIRSMAEQLDRRGQRDEALRAAFDMIAGSAPSTRAKALQAEVRSYLTGAWLRGDRDLASPPSGASALRQSLWRFVRLNGGDGLGWRQILRIVE